LFGCEHRAKILQVDAGIFFLALIGKVPSGTLWGEACEWYRNFRVSINEIPVEVFKLRKD